MLPAKPIEYILITMEKGGAQLPGSEKLTLAAKKPLWSKISLLKVEKNTDLCCLWNMFYAHCHYSLKKSHCKLHRE